MKFDYTPEGVCPSNISFELEGDVVRNIAFTDGCNGNLKALSKVVDGMTVDHIERMFGDITCGGNTTSCSAQLAKAVRQKYEESK